jgi:hypothetical protein
LIERVSDAVGGIFKPHQIKRIAKAEAAAEKIKTLEKIEISEIEQRAFTRLVKEEGKKQENIERITFQAAQQLGDKAKPEDLDDDWIVNFFEKCRTVSDNEMQILWAKILAGEATTPGTYAKRTVNFVPNLDKNDCQMFTKLCTFGWQIGGLTPLVFDIPHEIYEKHDITFDVLKHLDDIGLITFNHVSGFRRMGIPKNFVVLYYGQPLGLEFPKDENNDLQIGNVLLTKIGEELAPICGSNRSDEFFQYVVEKWIQKNLSPHSPLT